LGNKPYKGIRIKYPEGWLYEEVIVGDVKML